jgi:hypothetical protein
VRPIERGASPRAMDYSDYRDAFEELVGRLGPYCSYCERRISTNLAVEHIQPKALAQYAALIGRWDNFLLGCVNCNSTKKDKDVVLADVYLPDRDNTFAVFLYREDGILEAMPSANATHFQNTVDIPGLNREMRLTHDDVGRLVATDRRSQRMEAWGQIEEALTDWQGSPTGIVKRRILAHAESLGFFSIWMKVFEGEIEIRQGLIAAFRGTAQDCFDPVTTAPISPRPANGLPYGGKI